MIDPDELKHKAQKRYRDCLAAMAEDRSIFPLEIAFSKVKPGEVSRRWLELGAELDELRRASDAGQPGRSYSVAWEERRDRLAGAQVLPARIWFQEAVSYLSFIGKLKEAEHFRHDVEEIMQVFPGLKSWITENPLRVIDHTGDWQRILAAVAWFRDNPESGLYLREVPAVEDTKFIERNKPIIRELLDVLSPGEVGLSARESFEARCGLRTISPTVRVRILDRAIANRHLSGVDDLAVPADKLGLLDFGEIRRILVIENKASFGNVDVFLTSPALPGTMAVFGSGYASAAMREAPWMASRKILYWGDIDTHGLRILGGFRVYFPDAISTMMDEATFDRFPAYHSNAPLDTTPEPVGLSPAELALFRRLASLGARNRLEQERLPLAYVRASLTASL